MREQCGVAEGFDGEVKMYGMVNAAVRGLVCENFGDDTWTKIHTMAGAPEKFVAMQSYPDEITYNLVGAAEKILDMAAPDILFAFGEYWVAEIATAHYASLMKASGSTFSDFLHNLDHMHQRIRVTFPDYSPPSFRVKVLSEGVLQVDYYSDREGLLPFVEGLFSGLAKHFKVEIKVEHISDDAHPLPCKRMRILHSERG